MRTRDRLDREIGMTNRVIDRYQRLVGLEVQWYEWDAADSTVDPVYDEGGDRVWFDPKTVHVLHLLRTEGEEVPSDTGFYNVDTVHLLLSVKEVTDDGLTNPIMADQHLKDRFVWDNLVWEVRGWHAEGRVRDHIVTLGVDATEMKADELGRDDQFAAFT